MFVCICLSCFDSFPFILPHVFTKRWTPMIDSIWYFVRKEKKILKIASFNGEEKFESIKCRQIKQNSFRFITFGDGKICGPTPLFVSIFYSMLLSVNTCVSVWWVRVLCVCGQDETRFKHVFTAGQPTHMCTLNTFQHTHRIHTYAHAYTRAHRAHTRICDVCDVVNGSLSWVWVAKVKRRLFIGRFLFLR